MGIMARHRVTAPSSFLAAMASAVGAIVGLPDRHIYTHSHGNKTVTAGSKFCLRLVVCLQFFASACCCSANVQHP